MTDTWRVRTTLTLAAGALGVCALAAAGIASADEGKSAQETIQDLQDKGYNVTIDKIGTAPLSDCVVTSVRNPQQFTQLVPLLGGNTDGVLFPQVISQPISVSLDCSR
ncbi:hypothetical protein [Mycolicibacterium gadium]|uniref:Uncharacterized protein n=1 Tax=Mycolicibacterium gadium TaxID=1794 RepID=A0A7I7WNL4_MYCGU|nr:hypothetical protein MGAD_30150 [Mycolicibacterium gadium]